MPPPVGRRPRADPTEAARRKLYADVLEAPFQRQVTNMVRQMGDLVFHDPDARTCPHCHQMVTDKRVRGFPDLFIARWPKIGRRAPWLILAELKTERGQLSPEQKAWGVVLSLIARVCPGFHYAVWRPSDLPKIIALLTDQQGPTPTHGTDEPDPDTARQAGAPASLAA